MGCSSSAPAQANASGGGGGGDSASVDANVQFLQKVDLFKRLPQEELPSLAKAGQDVSFANGSVIITQGDEGAEFFVIKSGSAAVEVSGKQVATLKEGDFFGENALLRNEPRNATIKASGGEVKALKITRESFTNLGLGEKLQFPKRGAVGGGAQALAEIKPPSPKTAEQTKLIAEALKANANLNTIAHLDDERIKAITDVMWKEDVKAGQKVVTEGDLQADYFYIVQEGSFTITKAEKRQSVAAAMETLGSVEAGGSFGELALLYFAPRAATITAKSDGSVWVTARQQFKEVLLKANEGEAKEHVTHIKKCSVFKALKDGEQKQLAEAMHEMNFSKEEEIFAQGESGTQFFLLIAGKVAVVKDGKEVSQLEASSAQAQYFGEKALETKEPRAATIKVISESAKTLWIDKESFEILLGSMADLEKRGRDGNADVKKGAVAPTAGEAKRFGNIKFATLKKKGLLGCGGFGAVELVEQEGVNDTYALKALSKGYVVKSGMQASVMSEKNVQLMADSPFIVKLYETYNSKEHLYFLLELALGGELYATYNKKNLWANEKCAKFYVAGTIFAFEHLHSKKIIFRDLKPENLLLNDQGHVKLTDMGLAKVVVGKTFTTCGTPDYFAPELIASKGHNMAVDWWTLGVLTFELMTGHPPFESATPMQIYSKVQKGINKVSFPKKAKGDCEALVKALCHSTPAERLPMKKGGTENIKKHAWYKGFPFPDVETFTADAPYKPVVKSKKDIANFSASPADMPPQVPYKDPKTGWDKDFATCS